MNDTTSAINMRGIAIFFLLETFPYLESSVDAISKQISYQLGTFIAVSVSRVFGLQPEGAIWPCIDPPTPVAYNAKIYWGQP
jgi:hypothetical protein